MPSFPFIDVKKLVQTINNKPILHNITLHINYGETLVLLGRSGGGKSLFLRHLIGLIKPTSGSIRIEGDEISHFSERDLQSVRRKIGMLFQDGALFDSMTVFQNIAFPLVEEKKWTKKEIEEKVDHALEIVGLTGNQDKMPVYLSGGMRKRVALARAIISEPSCILYDEPTAGLDPIVSDIINKLIRRLQNQLSVTSVVVTHDMVSTNYVADRVALLHDGLIHYVGTVKDLNLCQDPIIQDFIHGRSYEIN